MVEYPRQLSQLRSRLIAQRDVLRAMCAQDPRAHDVGRDTAVPVTAVDRGAAALVGRRRAKLQLRRVDAALQRMDAGSYGTCLQCDGLIDAARLSTDPASPLCSVCAAELGALVK